MSQFEIMASFGGFDDFLLYLAIAGVLLTFFLFLYIRITPYKELPLIREGNLAAAYSLCGTIIGMVIPLANAIEYGVNPIDTAIWGAIALLVQLFVFVIARIALPNIVQDIPAGKQASGLFLGVISIAAGVLNAACMTY